MSKPETKYVILPFIVLYFNDILWLEGHIYKAKRSLFLVKQKERYWKNFIRVIHSYIRGSTKRLQLEINFNGKSYGTKTSKRGQFNLVMSCSDCVSPNLKQLEVYLIRHKQRIKLDVPEPFNHCFFSFDHAGTAVVSDIDDTVLVTHTTNTIRKIRTLLVKNAMKRKAVTRMRSFYRKFSEKGYPFIYVTNSESNLFPMIRLFLEHNHFPIGPVFLKPYVKWKNIFKRKKKPVHEGHKKVKIKFLLDSFPEMNFILIGDDSQKDPEIYASMAENFPGRIQGIYIRNVKKRVGKRRIMLRDQIQERHGVQFEFFKDPEEITR